MAIRATHICNGARPRGWVQSHTVASQSPAAAAAAVCDGNDPFLFVNFLTRSPRARRSMPARFDGYPLRVLKIRDFIFRTRAPTGRWSTVGIRNTAMHLVICNCKHLDVACVNLRFKLDDPAVCSYLRSSMDIWSVIVMIDVGNLNIRFFFGFDAVAVMVTHKIYVGWGLKT